MGATGRLATTRGMLGRRASMPERHLLRFLFENASDPTVVLEGEAVVLRQPRGAARWTNVPGMDRLFADDAPWNGEIASLRLAPRAPTGTPSREIEVPDAKRRQGERSSSK